MAFGSRLRAFVWLLSLLLLFYCSTCYVGLDGVMLEGLRVGLERGFGLGSASGLQSYVVWLVRSPVLWVLVVVSHSEFWLCLDGAFVHVHLVGWSLWVLKCLASLGCWLVILILVLRCCLVLLRSVLLVSFSVWVLVVFMVLDQTVGSFLHSVSGLTFLSGSKQCEVFH